jgi:CAAX protease family protein
MDAGEWNQKGEALLNDKTNYKPWIYFLIVFLITWSAEFIAAYFSYRQGTEELLVLFLLVGVCGPAATAVIMIYRSENPALWEDYVDRLVNLRRVNLAFVPLAIFLMPAVILVSILLSLPFGQPASQFSLLLQFGFSVGFMPVLLWIIIVPALEEMGWRGYGVDSLRSRFCLLTTSLWFGLLWALWHLPTYFVNNFYQNQLLANWVYALNFMVSVFPMAFILNWLYYRNNRSIVACFLFHFSADIASETIQATQFTKCIVTAVLILITFLIVAADRKMFLEKTYSGTL